MRKNFLKVFGIALGFLVVSCLLYFFLSAEADTVSGPLTYDESYDVVSIHNLNIKAKVNKNNKIVVEEQFEVTFNQNGLTEVVRIIPYVSTMYREDKAGDVKKTTVVSQISDAWGKGENNEKFNIYKDEVSGYLTFGLKDYKGFVQGSTRTYTIGYTYDLGKDYNKGFDDVYFNIVGTNSYLTIRDISFEITLPSDVEDAKNIHMYVGKAGSTSSQSYIANGNKITGGCSVLKPLEGITFRVIYKDGFLSGSGVFSWSAAIALILSIVVVSLGVMFIVKLKQKQNYPKPVELMPFEGLTPSKAEYYSNRTCSNKGLIATIVVLASKGYLIINEIDKKEIELIKQNEMNDTEDASLKALYNAIFVGGKDKVKLSELDVSFVSSCSAITISEKAKCENNFYEKNAKSKHRKMKILTVGLAVAIMIFLFIATTTYLGFSSDYYGKKLFVLAIVVVLALLSMSLKDNNIIIGSIITCMLFGMGLYLYIARGFRCADTYYLGFISLILLGVGITLMGGECLYSDKGKKEKGRVLGFKNFIRVCEVAQIQAFAEKDPSYYYDVLPYAYVFNLTDVWIKKFENIKFDIPEWITLNGDTIYDFYMFSSIFNNFTFIANTNHYKLLAKQTQGFSSGGSSRGFSGGFGGGGGFSGGGGGGGGFGAR